MRLLIQQTPSIAVRVFSIIYLVNKDLFTQQFHFSIPDTAKVKLKMMYSSSKSALTKVLESKSVVDIHVNEADDITNRSAMKAEVLSKSGSK